MPAITRINAALPISYHLFLTVSLLPLPLTSPTPVTIHSVFDSDGRRIAEYNEGTGALIREYVWNGWDPVAVIEGGVISFVRTDHIARPVFATNAAGTKVWTATYLPFGGVHTSTGTLPSARFPGQWFQSESGLHQNWMRDYDPTTGRYLQADPLGLVDGASVYGYVGQNPGRWNDPKGLERGNHKTGQWIECSKNCRIRIDYVLVNGTKVRHLHWECKGDVGVCGEFGEDSHGQGWEDAPKEVRECARKNGFEGSFKPLSSLADLVLLGFGAWILGPSTGGVTVGGGGVVVTLP